MLLLFGLAKMKFILSLSKLNQTETKNMPELMSRNKVGSCEGLWEFHCTAVSTTLEALPH